MALYQLNFTVDGVTVAGPPGKDGATGDTGITIYATHTARNAASTTGYQEGILVYTQDDQQYWRLNAAPWTNTDADWTIERFRTANYVGTPQNGVGFSGLEFGSAIPGTVNTDYFAPTDADFAYFASKGFTQVRLPYEWTRLQPIVGGALDPTYKGYIDAAIASAKKYGIQLILDCHNYGRRYVPIAGGFTNDFSSSTGTWSGGQQSGGKYITDPNSFFSTITGGDTRNPVTPATGYIFTTDIAMTSTPGGTEYPSLDIKVFDDGTGNNYYRFSLDKSSGVYSWGKRVAGTNTSIGQSAATITVGTTYTVSIDVGQTTPGSVICKVNGSTIATFATDAALTGGRISITANFAKASIDNVTLNVAGDTSAANASGVYRVGDAQLSIANFANLWSRLATAYATETGIFMFDLMNEWHDMPVPLSSSTYNSSATVTLAHQAAINAIRAVDTLHYIALEGDRYAGLQSFTSCYGTNPNIWWSDSANKTMISFHYYQDSASTIGAHSGVYDNGWLQADRDNLLPDALPALEWAKNNSVLVYVGEYGVPNTNDSNGINWRKDEDRLLSIFDSYGVYRSQWAAGNQYTATTTLQPTSNYTVDRAQMAVIQKHLGYQSTAFINANLPSATSTTKGGITLGSGDLGGSYNAVTVPGRLSTDVQLVTPGLTIPYQRGGNISGLEFNQNVVPGTIEVDYFPPNREDVRYLARRGFTMVRIPFLWERLQPTVYGALDATYKGYIDTLIGYAKEFGMKVILDCHNYGRRYIGATLRTVGDGMLLVNHFGDLWVKIAQAYVGNETVFVYDLMNEWNNMPVPLSSSTYNSTATVTLANQAAINGIRNVDKLKWIALESDQYSGAHNFTSMYGSNPTKWWTDAQNRTMVSFHYYQDPDHSGSYSASWTNTTSTRITGELTPVLSWCQTNNVICYFGEYGVPNDTSTSSANYRTDMDTVLSLLDTYNAWGTHWAGGRAYTSATSLTPSNNYTTDTLQIPILLKHLGQQGSKGSNGAAGAQGVQGPPGPPFAVSQGAYNNAFTYAKYDYVSYNGSTFIATAGTTGVNPGTPTALNAPWQVLAAKGDTGAVSTLLSASPTGNGYLGWNYDPMLIATPQTPTNGVQYMGQVSLLAGTITNLHVDVATAIVTPVAGQNVASLYKLDGTLLGTTVDQGTNWATIGPRVMALTTPVTVTAGYYLIGILANAASVQLNRASSSGHYNNGMASPYRQAIVNAGSLTAPPSPLGTVTATNTAIWVAAS